MPPHALCRLGRPHLRLEPRRTLTRTFGENAITKASQIAIVFNADEPSGNSITLTGLQMSVFNGNTDIFDAHLAALETKLDALQNPATVAGLRIGLTASASDATGGPETFNQATITAVPESGGTLLFTATALAGLSFVAWRRRNKSV